MNRELIQNPDFQVNRESTIRKYYWIMPALRFTIQVRNYDSKSHFLMSHESLIQFSIESIKFSVESIQFFNQIYDKFDSN